MSRGLSNRLIVVAVIVYGLAHSEASAAKPIADASPASLDANWTTYPIEPGLTPESIDKSSFYLTMRDGVKIAVTLYLPAEIKSGEKRPAILRSTRYMRDYDLRWPFNGKEVPHPRICSFLANGYIWLSVDARGSGASFGTWPAPWSPDEVKDYAEICDWMVSQPWSDGTIGCCGISYEGTSAEMTVTTLHPAIKAVVPEFCLFDAYADVAFPGGIHLSEFTRKWSDHNAALDVNAIRKQLKGIQRYVLKGVMPVDGDNAGTLLKAAVQSHNWNGNVYRFTASMNFRDDFWASAPCLAFHDISPSGKIAELKKSGIPIYSYSGWFDAAYQNSAIKRHLAVNNQGSKLVIGPWSHAGYFNSAPNVQAKTSFNHSAELIRFFDFHLKGKQNGIDGEPAIHYYTMVEEKWKSCDVWPPAADMQTYYFAASNRLDTSTPTVESAADIYFADYSAGTGKQSRWDTLLSTNAATYPNRAADDRKLLVYTTEPLAEETEVTGHPIVTLFVDSTAADGQFFAYLEDVDERGAVHYVSEGELRALCRKLSRDTPTYIGVVPYHSYLRKDAETLTPGTPAELVFDVLPTSYLFKRGHRIRIALANADCDHFQPNQFKPPTIRYLRDSAHPSRIVLPVINR